MTTMTRFHTRNPLNYDTDQRTLDRTLWALNQIAVSRRVPTDVAIHARQRRDLVDYTGRVGESRQWVRTQWAAYMVTGSVPLAWVAGITALFGLHAHTGWSILAAIGGFVATLIVTRRVRAWAMRTGRSAFPKPRARRIVRRR